MEWSEGTCCQTDSCKRTNVQYGGTSPTQESPQVTVDNLKVGSVTIPSCTFGQNIPLQITFSITRLGAWHGIDRSKIYL